jgi:hypothetical protein
MTYARWTYRPINYRVPYVITYRPTYIIIVVYIPIVGRYTTSNM